MPIKDKTSCNTVKTNIELNRKLGNEELGMGNLKVTRSINPIDTFLTFLLYILQKRNFKTFGNWG